MFNPLVLTGGNGSPAKGKLVTNPSPVKKTANQKPSDFAKKLRAQNPSVSDKIKQWQNLGGGLAPPQLSSSSATSAKDDKDKGKERAKDKLEEVFKKEDTKKEDAQKEEAKKEEAKKEEAKREEAKKEEAKKDEAKKDEARKQAARNEQAKKEAIRKEEARKAELKREEAIKAAKKLEDDSKKNEEAMATKSAEPEELLEPPKESGTDPQASKPVPKILNNTTLVNIKGKGPAIVRPIKIVKKLGHKDLDEDLLNATAPKKRVVSDEHWRNSQMAAKPTGAKPAGPKGNAWVRPARRPSQVKAKMPPLIDAKPARAGPQSRAVIGIAGGAVGTRRRRRSAEPNPESDSDTREGHAKSSSSIESEEEARPSAIPSSPSGHKIDTRRKAFQDPSLPNKFANVPAPLKIVPKRRSSMSRNMEQKTRNYHSDIERNDRDSSQLFQKERRPSSHRLEGMVDTPWDHYSRRDSPAQRKTSRQRSRTLDARKTSRSNEAPQPEPEAQAIPSGNRIQAWLTAMPDPLKKAKRRSTDVDPVPSKADESTIISSADSNQDSDVSTLSKETEKPRRSPKGSPKRSPKSSRRRRSSQKESTILSSTSLDDSSYQTTSEPTEISIVTETTDTTATSAPGSLRRKTATRGPRSPVKGHFKSRSQDDRDSSVVSSSIVSSSIVSSSIASSSAVSSSVDNSLIDLPPPMPAPLRRFFPSGKKLSTIVSVDTSDPEPEAAAPSVSDMQNINPSEMETAPPNDKGLPRRRTKRGSVKNKLASSSDLMSVLSLNPVGRSKSIVSARSIRTNRSRLATANIGDLMKEFAADEAKYMRELRTLVDGVIPVLLTCVLSKSDTTLAAGLFSRNTSSTDSSQITQPILDMGLSLDRLKLLHKRAPLEDPEALLSWAQSAQRAYSAYVKSWRLGFQDVVVNLAPATDNIPTKSVNSPEGNVWDEGLPRNEEGYVVNGDGERVDVAFLLKRPLVRLKYLSKTFKGVNILQPSEKAESIASNFQNLVIDARKRSNQEHARLEEEAAAAIDATRSRDPRSLAPVSGVVISPNRCVKARDYFDMHLLHSSGQMLDCRIELLMRDDAPGQGNGGDFLLCEVDDRGRWLLFPPIYAGQISARPGDQKGEFIVMIRGSNSAGGEWSELLSLKCVEDEVAFEWVQLLGLKPVPPAISRTRSFMVKTQRPVSSHGSSVVSDATTSTIPFKSRSPSPREVEIPMGEQASVVSKRWSVDTPARKTGGRRASEVSPVTSGDELSYQERSRDSPVSPPSPGLEARSNPRRDKRFSTPTKPRHQRDGTDDSTTPRTLNEAMDMAGRGSPTGLKRTKATRQSQASPRASRSVRSQGEEGEAERRVAKLSEPGNQSEVSYSSASQVTSTDSSASTVTSTSKGFSVWFPSSEPEDLSDDDDDDYRYNGTLSTVASLEERPRRERRTGSEEHISSRRHRRTTSVPSMDLPTVPRSRKSSQPSTPLRHSESVDDTSDNDDISTKKVPSSAPPKLQRLDPIEKESSKSPDTPPAPPPHRSKPIGKLNLASTPELSSTSKIKRRSSSPLKHEYQPSTASESSEESEDSYESHSDASEEDMSDISELSEDDIENDVVPTPLPPIPDEKLFPKVSPPGSIYSLPNATISPSQSASNSPYRKVPQGSGKASRTIASIFAWSDKGLWESLHKDECSIVITPGLIEAFDIDVAHSKPILADGDDIRKPNNERPLVALELTPLVPLRRGTALDISIRSPPTADSKLRTSNNIMFRSRTPEECEVLYNLLNQCRINNPTYVALQNARGPYGQSTWASAMDRRNESRSGSGSSSNWWNLGGTLGRTRSYRASSIRASSAVNSESSVGTMSSAFSALKRFGATNRLFNVAKSTVTSRQGSQSSHFSGSGSGSSTPTGAMSPPTEGPPIGIANTKIRIYERITQTKWRDMGSARLSILNPDPNNGSVTRQGTGGFGVRQPGTEKRIIIIGKSNNQCMMDVTLGESCFERVARTGIAISVWEDVRGPNGEIGQVGAIGGVSGAKAKIYMIQMKTERECAYSFSLLGKLRY